MTNKKKQRDKFDSAHDLLEVKGGYYRMNDEIQLAPEPSYESYKSEDKYLDEVDQDFEYEINYYYGYGKEYNSSRPDKWEYFVTTFENQVSERFPRDQDMRDFIKAFRLTVVKNQLRNIRKKRALQSVATISLMVPFVKILLFPDDVAREINYPVRFLESLETSAALPSLSIFSIYVLFAMSIAFLILCAFFLNQTTNRIKDSFEVDASIMDRRMQTRLNSIQANYLRVTRDIAVAPMGEGGVEDENFPAKAKVWSELIFWWPRRILYAEQFYQAEMQRIRIFILWSDIVGNLSALGLAIFFIGAIFLICNHGASVLPPSVQLVICLIVGLIAVFIAWFTTRKRFSINIGLLVRFLGRHNWPTFSELKVHEDFGEQIRSDMQAIRDERKKRI